MSCASFSKKEPAEYKPIQYAKNDYRVLKKENRYTGTFMIRQKSNGFFIPDEQISVDMDIVISSLKVPYLRVSYYGNEQLAIPDKLFLVRLLCYLLFRVYIGFQI